MKKFVLYLFKVAGIVLLLMAASGLLDRYTNTLMLPREDVKSIELSDDIFIGSSHTMYHLNPALYDSLTSRKSHVVATGAQYSVESLSYLYNLAQRSLLSNKTVYIQLETTDGINVHPDKSWMMLNLPKSVYSTIWNNSSVRERYLFIKSMFIDVLSIEYIQKVRMQPYTYRTADEVRKFVAFRPEEYKLYQNAQNGKHTDEYGQSIITSFLADIPRIEEKFNCKIIYYVAGGCHSNYYSESNKINDLRWMSFMEDSNLWRDTNHLNGRGARKYTTTLVEFFHH